MDKNLLQLVFLLSCMLAFMAHSLFVYLVYVRFIFRREKDLPYNHEPISILIASHNEAENLRQNLEMVIQQDRAVFEVLVVDDGSTDETAEVLRDFAEKYPQLRILRLAQKKGKKAALQLAIEQASYDLLLFTDADCKPASKMWASEMASHFTEGVEIVLGYGAYDRRKSILNRIIQLETALTAARYAGFTLWKNPNMGVGRNMAYRKSLWLKVGGFASHADLPYGDDDLFIQSAATNKNTALCFHPNAYTYSVPETSFSGWKKQKKRHLHAGKRYKKKISLLLGIEMASELLFWLSGLGLFCVDAGLVFVFFLSFYMLNKFFILSSIYKLLNIKANFFLSSILSVVLLFALFLFGINAIFARQVKWKQE